MAKTKKRRYPPSTRFYDSADGDRYTSPALLKRRLQPLTERLEHYDCLRHKLEQEGGSIVSFKQLADCLAQPISLGGNSRSRVCLKEQKEMRYTLRDIGGQDLCLDVRQLDNRLPVYYLCRIRRDWWGEYSLVVEDLYRSPGYPLVDERFTRLMDRGRDTFFLRLSPFRQSVTHAFFANGDEPERHTDHFLYELGRYLLQAAWHEDQRPGILAAKYFDLPNFHQAIEVIYLCLNSDLCQLRSRLQPQLLCFFDQLYPQPGIGALLELLPKLEGAAINDKERQALSLYSRLMRAFSRFLKEEVQWGTQGRQVPLYKVLFANFDRLDQAAPQLANDPSCKAARAALEKNARNLLSQLLSR